jgi:hypothetical protein
MWRLTSRLGLVLLLAVIAQEGSCFVPTVHIRSLNGACYMSGGQVSEQNPESLYWYAFCNAILAPVKNLYAKLAQQRGPVWLNLM